MIFCTNVPNMIFFFGGGGGGEASDFVDKLAKKPNLTELGGLQTWGKCIF